MCFSVVSDSKWRRLKTLLEKHKAFITFLIVQRGRGECWACFHVMFLKESFACHVWALLFRLHPFLVSFLFSYLTKWRVSFYCRSQFTTWSKVSHSYFFYLDKTKLLFFKCFHLYLHSPMTAQVQFVRPSGPSSWMWEFHQICHKRQREFQEELMGFWWSKVTVGYGMKQWSYDILDRPSKAWTDSTMGTN